MSMCYLGFADPLKSQFLFNQNKTLKMEADRVSKFFVVLELESVKNYSNCIVFRNRSTQERVGGRDASPNEKQ